MKIGALLRESSRPYRPIVAALIGLPLVLLLVVLAQQAAQHVRPSRAPGSGANTTVIKSGRDFQRALDSARPGDTIVLEAGVTFLGPFTLPDKGAGESYITVRSSRLEEIAEGVRVTPVQAPLMPRIVTPGRGEPALRMAAGAHHYKLIGLEIAQQTKNEASYDLVKLGDGAAGAQTSLEQVPHHVIIDRCYVHAADDGELKRGIALNSAQTEITNSHVSGFKVRGQEAQAIAGWNGPGPFRIINNYIEGAGENLIFGGAAAQVPGLIPSDIEIRRNHFNKPASWRGIWTVKNLLELKNARRVIIEGNLFERCWLDAQVGYAILFTPRPNDSGAWAVVEDVKFVNNIVRHVAAGVHVLGQDSLYAAGPRERRLRRVYIMNNLFDDVNHAHWGGDGAFLKLVSGTEEVSVEHNTVLQSGNIIKAGGDPHTGFTFRHNVVRHNEYGVHGDDVGYGIPALERYFPGARFTQNLIVREINAPANTEKVYPPGNAFPKDMTSVGFVNAAEGNFRLLQNSPYKSKALGGNEPGCDYEKILAALGPQELKEHVTVNR